MPLRAIPKLNLQTDVPIMHNYTYPPSTHSRDSSSASNDYSPITPTFSNRESCRVVSSCSSLSSTPPSYEYPDSPCPPSKTMLHDLVEEPCERDESFDMCDDARKQSSCSGCDARMSSQSLVSSLANSPNYNLDDGFCSESDVTLRIEKKRQFSGEPTSPVSNLAARIGQRLPSISRRLRERKPSISINTQGVRSAPISRTSSFRMPSVTKSLASQLDIQTPSTPPHTPVEGSFNGEPREEAIPLEIGLRPPMEDPIDRQALASTPLLPPTMMTMQRRTSEPDSMQSPLQSPTVADPFFFTASPSLTPSMSAVPTPPLSTKHSMSSFGMVHSPQLVPSADIPPLVMTNRIADKWASKLGHANYDIFPEPYLPDVCDVRSCRQLTNDWEYARKQYLNHAAHTSENYGPTSQTFKLTEQKWFEIDARWKKNHEMAISLATAKGERPLNQPLAEPAALAKMPSIGGPESKGKFPAFESTEIVGPMVQYAKVHQRPTKRSAFLKFFSELRPTSSDD